MTITKTPETAINLAPEVEVLLQEAKRRWRLRRLAISVAVLVAVAVALVLAGASGAGGQRTSTNAGSSGVLSIAPATLKVIGFPASRANISLTSVSCASGTACIVVGDLGQVGIATKWRSAAWLYEHGAWRQLAPPLRTNREGSGQVSCPTTAFCVMASNHLGFTLASKLYGSVQVYEAGRWHETVTPAPGGATESSLKAVDCLSSQWCMALGVAQVHFGSEAYADVFANGRWSLLKIPRPMGDHEPGAIDVGGVSCTSTKFCLAVGDAPGVAAQFATAERYDGHGWSLVPVDRIPQGLLGRPPRIIEGKRVTVDRFGESLTGVSCIAPRDCTASGTFSALTGIEEGGMFVMHYEGARLTRSVLIAEGQIYGHPDAGLGGIACSSASRCTSWESTFDGAIFQIGRSALGAVQSDSSGWFRSTHPYRSGLSPLPADVACLPTGRCLIVGELEDTGSIPHGYPYGRWFALTVLATPRAGL